MGRVQATAEATSKSKAAQQNCCMRSPYMQPICAGRCFSMSALELLQANCGTVITCSRDSASVMWIGKQCRFVLLCTLMWTEPKPPVFALRRGPGPNHLFAWPLRVMWRSETLRGVKGNALYATSCYVEVRNAQGCQGECPLCHFVLCGGQKRSGVSRGMPFMRCTQTAKLCTAATTQTPTPCNPPPRHPGDNHLPQKAQEIPGAEENLLHWNWGGGRQLVTVYPSPPPWETVAC